MKDEKICVFDHACLHEADENETTVSESPSVTGYEDLAREIVDGIIGDLTRRKGLRHEYYLCDPDIREEIRDAWRQIIEDELGKSL